MIPKGKYSYPEARTVLDYGEAYLCHLLSIAHYSTGSAADARASLSLVPMERGGGALRPLAGEGVKDNRAL